MKAIGAIGGIGRSYSLWTTYQIHCLRKNFATWKKWQIRRTPTCLSPGPFIPFICWYRPHFSLRLSIIIFPWFRHPLNAEPRVTNTERPLKQVCLAPPSLEIINNFISFLFPILLSLIVILGTSSSYHIAICTNFVVEIDLGMTWVLCVFHEKRWRRNCFVLR